MEIKFKNSLGGFSGPEVEVIGRVHPGDDVTASAATRYVRRLAVHLNNTQLLINEGYNKGEIVSQSIVLSANSTNVTYTDKATVPMYIKFGFTTSTIGAIIKQLAGD